MTLLFRLLGRLPLRFLYALGALSGWITYLASPTYRRHTKENLALAYGPAEAEAILPAAVTHAGRGVLELPLIWLRDRREVAGLVRQVTGWEVVEHAQARGEGILFLTPHLGCFDIIAQYLAVHMKLTVLYRPPKLAWLKPLMEEGRGGGDLHLAQADLSGVRLLLRALKRREAIGMLPDQVPGEGEGIWADFFGRKAFTMTLAARLTEVGKVSVILTYAERLPKGAGFHVHFLPPQMEIEGALEQRVAALNLAIEALVRRCPEQYLWGYNRYKAPRGAPPPC
ncbi:MAG: lysophospholipid acyltransferase family protein [Betaproteobacteria bacterium]|jgi:KDO2-lipid IV(A) lauroyltransferase|nr:lysophospholipid acyltransferase family protein [Betaproteobacteria bacterium]